MKYLIVFVLTVLCFDSAKAESNNFFEIQVKSKTDYSYTLQLGLFIENANPDSFEKAKKVYVEYITKRVKDFSTHFVVNNREILINESWKEINKIDGIKVDGLSILRIVERNGKRDIE